MTEYKQLTRLGQIRRLRQVAEQALALYGIEPLSISLLAHVFNTTFTVIGLDGTRYVLHILRPIEDQLSDSQTHARAESELWWLDRVRVELGLSVPAPVRTPGGEGVVNAPLKDTSALRLCTLFHWVDGRFLHRRILPVHLEAVGCLTARLHDYSSHLSVPNWFDRPGVDSADAETEEEVVHLFRNNFSPASAEVMRAVFQRVRRAQAELDNNPETSGLIHADIHQGNYLFHGHEVRLIDFGDCGWGHYLYDLGVTLSELADLPHHTALRGALLAGYRSVRNLSPAEEASIDTFVMLREVQNVTWFLKARNDPSYGARFSKVGERVTMLERMLVTGR